MITSCDFTSTFSTISACWKPIVKYTYSDHLIGGDCNVYKCALVAKCLNGNHGSTGYWGSCIREDWFQNWFYYTIVTSNGH